MFTSTPRPAPRLLVALAVAASLGLPLAPATAAASDRGDPAGYAPAGTHEVIVESVPVPEAPPTPPEVIVVEAPAPPAPPAPPPEPTTTTVIVTAPAPAPAPPRRPPPPPRRGLGLMITGFSMFGTTYLLTAWAGALTHDGHGGCNRSEHSCREIGKALMVPFVGPIIAAQGSDSARETMGLLMVSGLQIASFTMGLIGAVRWSRYKRWERNFAGLPLGKSGLALQPMPRFDGGGLGLNYRF